MSENKVIGHFAFNLLGSISQSNSVEATLFFFIANYDIFVADIFTLSKWQSLLLICGEFDSRKNSVY